MVFVEDDPSYDWTRFDFATPPDNLDEFRAIVDAVDPDLSAFKQRGGKLLSYFGWADPDINPLTLLAYRDAVAATDLQIADYFRTFMMPGMFHCAGGAGPDRFDAMSALVDWVELGRAPEQLATWQASTDNKRENLRPSCAHPAQAQRNEANAWICTVPDDLN